MRIVAGFGFRAAATADSLRSALGRAAGDRRVALLAAPADKAEAACLRAVAATLNLPVVGVAAAALAATETVTRSPRAHAARGVGSVAEAAALAAAGPGGRLVGARHISEDRLATCAIAAGDDG